MEIQHRQSGDKGSFFVEADNSLLAEMTYSLNGSTVMVIEHTEVDPSLRGKNMGMQLVDKGVCFARQNQMKIKATCTFARKVFDKHPELYSDILF